MNANQIIKDTEERMEKAVQHLHQELVGVRTGRASPALVESVKVEYYGTVNRLKDLANVTAPEPQSLVIRPFDMSALKEMEKAILASGLGLTPNNDGKLLRITVPALSGDQRKKLAARIKELAEEAKVSIRNVRRDSNKHAEQAEKAKTLSEDDCKRLKDQVQELTKKYEKKAQDVADKKTAEVMQ